MKSTYLKLPSKKQLKMHEDINVDNIINIINELKQCKDNRLTSNKLITNLFRRIANRQCKEWRKLNPQNKMICPICKVSFDANEKLDCDHGDYTFDLINDCLNAYFKIPFVKTTFTDDEILLYSTVFDKVHNILVTNSTSKGWTYMHPKCHKIDDHDDCKQHGGGKLLLDIHGKVYYQGKNEIIKRIVNIE